MKIKTKIFALAVALGMLLAVPILTGCEKSNRDAGGNAEPETYTVTFISDGGTAVSAQTVKKGEKATKPADPTKTVTVDGETVEYEFSGWYSGETLWNFGTMKVTQDTVLTAKWIVKTPAAPEIYTVTFISDGGTAVSAQTVKEGEKATKPADPIKTVVVNGTVIDYEFSGWYSGETLWNFETMKVMQDTVLTAKWTQDYTPPYLPTN